MIPALNNKHLAGVGLSSMWMEGLAEGAPRTTRQSLLYLGTGTTLYREFQNGLRRMVGLTDVIVEDQVVRFAPGDVTQIGPNLQERILAKAQTPEGGLLVLRKPPNYSPLRAAALQNENEELILNESGDVILTFVAAGGSVSFSMTSGALSPKYVVPIPLGLRPSVLRAGERVFVTGLDFTPGEGCLVFHEPPEKLFPEAFFMMASAETSTTSPLSFTWQMDDLHTPGKHVAHYLRESQSLQAFRLAVLEAAGICLLPADGVLQDVKITGRLYRYVFEDFVVEVDYPHTPLEIGNFYAKDTAVGSLIQVFGPASGMWWRALNWSEGLPLDGLCPFAGLIVPDRIVQFEVSGGGYRFEVLGDAATQERFWAYLRQVEVFCGKSMAAVLSGTERRNPIDFIFQYLLGSRAIVIAVEESAVGGTRARNALNFARREKPAGSVIITKQI